MDLLANVLTVADPGYSPADFGTDIATNIGVVMAFVGIAITSAIVVFFTLLGIKRGVTWLRKLV